MVLTQSQLKDIQEIIDRSIKSLLSEEQFFARIVDAVAKTVECSIQPVLNAMNDKVAKVNESVNILRKEQTTLTEQQIHIKMELDSLEQYSRRNNIRIFGIPEVEKENTYDVVVKLFGEKLGINMGEEAIDRTHRAGLTRNGKRPVIVKFISYQFKTLALQKRPLLKGTGIYIAEDLTQHRLQLFKAAQNLCGKRNVWTMDGAVWVNRNKERMVIRSLEQLGDGNK